MKLEKPISRWESKAYRRAVSELECFVCGSPDVQVSHYKGMRQNAFGGGRGLKTHDFLATPLCPEHHSEYESQTGVFSLQGLDVVPFVAKLIRSEAGLHMSSMTLARLLDSGEFELVRKR